MEQDSSKPAPAGIIDDNNNQQQSQAPGIPQEWIQSVVGRDWEVFWKPAKNAPAETVENSATTTSSGHQGDDEKNASADEEDWYAARIESYLGNQNGSPLFQISFVGDDEEYVMVATPENVRPSSRAWVSRTQALVHDYLYYEGDEELPHDTRQLVDMEKLKEIESQCRSKYSTESDIPSSGVWLHPDLLPDSKDLKTVLDWMVLIEQQIYFRQQLGHIDQQDGDENVEPDDDEPSETYLDYLAGVLRDLSFCCRWYCESWKLHFMLSRGQPCTRLTSNAVKEEFLYRGLQVMQNLVSLDTSAVAAQGKRRSVVLVRPEETSGRKRRRKTPKQVYCDFVTPGSKTEITQPEAVANEDMLSHFVVEKITAQVRKTDGTDTTTFCNMLLCLSANISSPLAKWQRKAELYLGENAVSGGIFSDLEASDKDVCSGDHNDHSLFQYVSFESIQDAVEKSRTDLLLQLFDLAPFVERLSKKMSTVQAFEEKTKSLAQRLYEEPIHSSGDEIYQSLIHLHKDLFSPDISNVDPIGVPGTPIPRENVGFALSQRKWILDLKLCEISRQRLSFLLGVLSSLEQLPIVSIVTSKPSVGGLDAYKQRALSLRGQETTLMPVVEEINSRIELESVGEKSIQESVLFTREGIKKYLVKLQNIKVIAPVEERLAARLDILNWKSSTETLLTKEVLHFSDIQKAASSAEIILLGRSPTRGNLIKNLEEDTGVESQLLQEIKNDMEEVAGSLYKKCLSLLASATSWKDRADPMLNTLRQHGNTTAGEKIEVDNVLGSLVPAWEIQNLVEEYGTIEVAIEGFPQLRNVSIETENWAHRMRILLSGNPESTETWMASITTQNELRPKGVDIEPRNESLDLVLDLLEWYSGLSKEIQNGTEARESILFDFLRKSCEIIHVVVCNIVNDDLLLKQNVDTFFHSFTKSDPHQLSFLSLSSDPWAKQVLDLLMRDSREGSMGWPLAYLAYESFYLIVRSKLSSLTRGDVVYLREVSTLLESIPDIANFRERVLIREAKNKVAESTLFENEVQSLVDQTKIVMRDCIRMFPKSKDHALKVKDRYLEVRSRTSRNDLRIEPHLENQLESDMRVCSWFLRATQFYPLFLINEKENFRIPWDALVKLHDSVPEWEEDKGDFTGMILRVKELYDAADAWQQEVSSLTNLSLRGGKKRVISPPRDGEDDQPMIDFEKVAELSDDPVLESVVMPREDAVKNMLENTEKFEGLLYDFFGRNFNETSADKAPYPISTSLVGMNGEFILYRLTRSPLFKAVQKSITEISRVGDKIFAESPGKGTFDWFCQAVKWIESLEDAVMFRRDGPREMYGMSLSDAKSLVESGNDILLHIPDDSRHTLGKHLVYISTNREGRMTVKSKKGGAHNSLGTTTICWLPILFEALRNDVGLCLEWEERFSKAESLSTKNDELLKIFQYFDTLTELLEDYRELFVSPPEERVAKLKLLHETLSSAVEDKMNGETVSYFYEQKYSRSEKVVKDREILLDSLLSRLSFGTCTILPEDDVKSISGLSTFREMARNSFKDAFVRGLRSMEIEVDDRYVISFLSEKAAEIEKALFEECQSEEGHSRISDSYRERTRAIKRSLEDTQEPKLLLSILNGELDGTALASISLDDLASQTVKQTRAEANHVAGQNVLLTSSVTSEDNSVPRGNVKKDEGALETNVSRTTEPTLRNDSTSVEIDKSIRQFPDGVIEVSGRGSVRPIAPPPLIASLRMASASASDSLICSSSGEDSFSLSIAKGSRKFSVSFCIERDSDAVSDHFLPDNLTEKGRCKAEEFESFFDSAFPRGKWSVAFLKMSVSSDERSMREYRKYSREYEMKSRIALFEVGTVDKLYILTPKLHRCLKKVSLASKNNAYGILMVRKGT